MLFQRPLLLSPMNLGENFLARLLLGDEPAVAPAWYSDCKQDGHNEDYDQDFDERKSLRAGATGSAANRAIMTRPFGLGIQRGGILAIDTRLLARRKRLGDLWLRARMLGGVLSRGVGRRLRAVEVLQRHFQAPVIIRAGQIRAIKAIGWVDHGPGQPCPA